MTGLFGRNGVGKSTLLDAIGLLFRRYSGFDHERLATSMRRYIRNVKILDVSGSLGNALVEDDNVQGGSFGETSNERFRIDAKFAVEDGRTYDVSIGNNPNQYMWHNGTIVTPCKWHPDDIEKDIHAQCYVTTYDRDLNKFQLIKSRWAVFKELFTAVSGFPVSKDEAVVDKDTDSRSLALIDQYVLGLRIEKPGEVITDRQCSDGEKKIIKNFTTLLNHEFIPSIILIDNVEMHVEIDRHMSLIRSIEKCFPDSQVVFTTHSEKIILEAPLEMLVSLTNKKISRSDIWRRRMSRVVKAMKLLYRDGKSVDLLKQMEFDLENHEYTDVNGMIKRITDVSIVGNNSLIMEMRDWV
jgi:energy-coupling factor transporter ATP-binding protein EcfA2